MSNAIETENNFVPVNMDDIENNKKDPVSHAHIMIENHGSLIPYDILPIEREAVNIALNASKNLPTLLISAGAYELFDISVYKASCIELVGSIGQCFMHIAIVYSSQHYNYPPGPLAFLSGLVVTLYIYQFAMSSGGHFNSLITMAAMTTGHIPTIRGLLYISCQVFGWYLGAEIMRSVISREDAMMYQLGRCNNGNKTYSQTFALEYMCCLILLFPVYGTAFNLRQREVFGPIYPPILIGITLAILIFMSSGLGTPPFTGAGMNPSLCSGIALSYKSIDGVDYRDVFRHFSAYWIAPIVASITHAAVYALMPPHHETILMENKMKKK